MQAIADLDMDLDERRDESGESQKFEKLYQRDQEMTEFIESFPAQKAQVRAPRSLVFMIMEFIWCTLLVSDLAGTCAYRGHILWSPDRCITCPSVVPLTITGWRLCVCARGCLQAQEEKARMQNTIVALLEHISVELERQQNLPSGVCVCVRACP